MATTATLTGQDIGQAERAMRAVLDRLLAATDTTFEQWVILNTLAAAGSPVDYFALVRRIAGALKVDARVVQTAISTLVARDLVIGPDDGGSPVGLTPEGESLYSLIREGIERIGQRLYGDMPRDDLATVHRVLGEITARANAELSS